VSDRSFEDRPAVLRCGRCGRFADWKDARLQIVCLCRAQIALPPVLVREASPEDRRSAFDLLAREFAGRHLISDEEAAAAGDLSLLVAETDGGVTGALAWRAVEDGLHIVAMATDPMWQRSGVGGHLLAEAEILARQRSWNRVIVTTTNDNIAALYFYQRRGYRMTAIRPRERPEGPTAGFAGIPIRDEVLLSKTL
jgi:ribosomal protein S18 acetylase RimI-like enzyme